MNILDSPVSIFANYNTASHPRTVTIRQFLTSTKYRDAVEKVRAIDDEAELKKLKSKLPGITPSGLFSYRADDALLKHSRLICLDIDFKENEAIRNFFELKEQLVKIPNVAFCIKSVSGKGYAVGIPIAYPERHRQHFDALKRIFWEKIRIKLDTKCRNESRLRGYSYDEDVYFNENAKVFSLYDEPKAEKPQELHYTPTNDNSRFERLVDEVVYHRIDLTADYGTWLVIGFALANELGESGNYYYHQLSQFYPKYKTAETDKQYQNCLRKQGKTSKLGLIFTIAKDHGITLPTHPTKPNNYKEVVLVGSPVKGQTTDCINDPEPLGYPHQWDEIAPVGYVPKCVVHTPASLQLPPVTMPPMREQDLIQLRR